MTSLVSTNGPSTTLSCPFVIRTWAPVATGISPPLSSMRPALISRSASLCIASMSSAVGAPWGRGDVTIYMKRMWDFSYGEPPAPPPLHSLANESTNQPPADRHPHYKKSRSDLRTYFYEADP